MAHVITPPPPPLLLKCCFTSTETVSLLGTGAQDVHLDFHTAPELSTHPPSSPTTHLIVPRHRSKLWDLTHWQPDRFNNINLWQINAQNGLN